MSVKYLADKEIGDLSLKEALWAYWEYFKFLYRALGFWLSLVYLLIQVFGALIPIAVGYAMAQLINILTQPNDPAKVWFWFWVLAGIAVLSTIFEGRFALGKLIQETVGEKVEIFAHYLWEKLLLSSPAAVLENSEFVKVVERAKRAVAGGWLNHYMSEVMFQVRTLITVFTLVGVLVWKFPGIVLLAIIVGLLYGYGSYKSITLRNKIHERNRYLELASTWALSDLRGPSRFSVIKYFGLADSLLKKFSFGISLDWVVWRESFVFFAKKYLAPLKVVYNAVDLGILVYLIRQVLRAGLKVGDFSFYYNSSTSLMSNLASVVTSAGYMFSESYYLFLYFKLVNGEVSKEVLQKAFKKSKLPAEQIKIRNSDLGKVKVSSLKGADIVAKRLSFRYPSGKKQVLSNININIPYGANIAIVGENGAGKTTLLKLILGAYPTYQGSLKIKDTEVYKYDQLSLSKRFSVLPQQIVRFPYLTVGQMIRLDYEAAKDADTEFTLEHMYIDAAFSSNKEKRKVLRDLFSGKIKDLYRDFFLKKKWNVDPDKDPKLIEVTKKVGMYEEVKKMPLGFNTPLSPSFANGVDLSSGQWQKLHIARVLYAPRDVLLLDEPTSAIDPHTALRLIDEIFELFKDRTVIVVSHRYATIVNADYIYVFRKGKIIEQGTLKELVRKKGYFAEAYEKERQRLEVAS